MLRAILYIVAVFITLSCQKGSEGVVPEGVLKLSFSEPELLDGTSVSCPEMGYSITIKKLLDGQIAYGGMVTEMEPSMALKSGIYTITVESGILGEPSYDAPYCFASQSVTISEGEIEEVAITNQVTSVAVEVGYSSELLAAYEAISVNIGGESGALLFSSDSQERRGYFPSEQTITVDITAALKGGAGTDNKSYTIHNSQESCHHRLLIDLAESSTHEPIMEIETLSGVGRE